jgi:type II secretory pathway pseudopilin PulG
VRARLQDESGFGLLELLIAMVVLNVALFATITAFNASTVAIARSGKVSAATAVADKQMEIYRSLQNCAIWLDPTTFPATSGGSADDALYRGDTNAYSYVQNGTKQTVAFFDKSLSTAAQGALPWSTSATAATITTGWSNDIATSCTPTAGTTPPTAATKAEQTVAGPDGTLYPVFTYIIIDQPSAASGTIPGSTYVKQVTVVVRDPNLHSRVLARESSVFNPITG